MKKINLPAVAFALLFNFNSGTTYSQSWLPQPVSSPYFEAMSGIWISEPYEFMGGTNKDVVTYSRILNGQFIEVKIIRSDEKEVTYEGMEIIKAGADGSLTGSFFDVFGNSRSNTYSGSMDGSKISFTGSSPVGNGTREIIIDGDIMTQNVTFTMEDDSGKKSPEQNIRIVYKRK